MASSDMDGLAGFVFLCALLAAFAAFLWIVVLVLRAIGKVLQCLWGRLFPRRDDVYARAEAGITGHQHLHDIRPSSVVIPKPEIRYSFPEPVVVSAEEQLNRRIPDFLQNEGFSPRWFYKNGILQAFKMCSSETQAYSQAKAAGGGMEPRRDPPHKWGDSKHYHVSGHNVHRKIGYASVLMNPHYQFA